MYTLGAAITEAGKPSVRTGIIITIKDLLIFVDLNIIGEM